MRTTGWLPTIGLLLAGLAGSGCATQVAQTPPVNPYDPFDQLAWALALVENNHVDPAERSKLIDGAIKGMVAELDAHSEYMTPQEFTAFNSDTAGRFAGIGIEVDFRNEHITVLAPMEGSPADRAGIKAGDEIVAIEGKPIQGERLDKIVAMMRGPEQTHVRISIVRTGLDKPLDLDIVREIIRVVSVVGKRWEGDIAYLRLRQFQQHTHDELLALTSKLRAESPKPLRGVVLDLRRNGGGLVDVAERIADEFLDSGGIYTTRHRGQLVDVVDATPGGALSSLPVVVLVDEMSASASELVTGALQDNRRGTVVGAQTFGKGSMQTIFELPGGAGMKLTMLRYYTPSGRAIQAQGIRPDVIIERSKPGPLSNFRESDMQGHLSAEMNGATIAAGSKPATILKAPESDEGITREVPPDPLKSNDFALATGYKMLLEKLGTPAGK